MPPKDWDWNWNPAAVNPSRPANTQNHCPLFKLAAETRNEIYELVYAVMEGDRRPRTPRLNPTRHSSRQSAAIGAITRLCVIFHAMVYHWPAFFCYMSGG